MKVGSALGAGMPCSKLEHEVNTLIAPVQNQGEHCLCVSRVGPAGPGNPWGGANQGDNTRQWRHLAWLCSSKRTWRISTRLEKCSGGECLMEKWSTSLRREWVSEWFSPSVVPACAAGLSKLETGSAAVFDLAGGNADRWQCQALKEQDFLRRPFTALGGGGLIYLERRCVNVLIAKRC